MARLADGPDGNPRFAGQSDSNGDSTLESLLAEPFQILRPEVQTLPFVFASGHSGRRYPAQPDRPQPAGPFDPAPFRRRLCGRIVCRRRRAGRADDRRPLSPRLLRRQSRHRRAGRRHVRCGAGTEYRHAQPAGRGRAGGHSPHRARRRGNLCRQAFAAAKPICGCRGSTGPITRPWRNWSQETSDRFGIAIVVDCHSMPSALSVPDIVLGDRYGASAPPLLTGWVENAFVGARFSVARNAPYAGGYTTMRYGRGQCGLFGASDRNQSRTLSGRRPGRSAKPAFRR